MNKSSIILARTDSEIQDIANLASDIWRQHFTPLIGEAQVTYMLEKFQSYPAIKEQIEQKGYEYYQLFSSYSLAGYFAIHQEPDSLLLSKFYIKQDFRGQHLASTAFQFMVNLCKERHLPKIWLTCNRDNAGSLSVYRHLGFQITDEQVTNIGHGFVMDDYLLTYQIPEEE